ncbi:MAG TPA: bifunctional DNA-formamidopyrimidine glycosylase/DNA-(apurinic or apyrimidinic site) lyase [Candidatus Saccharimonadales bacterium]|nr:bifunctional DNA-formamidopyrimidine glycosylase/DNA-(apurinic or apyrimidinic site) lyase [Candidatus Saccharimonadales bacterium]
MPELPEVETIRRDLTVSIIGQEINAVKLIFLKTAKNKAAFFVKQLVGHKITEIGRTGKLLILKIKKKVTEKEQRYLLVHLKMTGQLILTSGTKKIGGGHSLSGNSFADSVGGELPNKYTRAIIEFKNKMRLFFNDLRKFGYLKIVDGQELKRIIAVGYGPEPLMPKFSAVYLADKLKNKKKNIKAFLLDQKMIAGLGNIYVDESLFMAGIKPMRIAASLKSAEIKKLYQEINKVIKKAIINRGTTFNNYVDSAGKKGNFSRLLKVYGRGKSPCLKCGRPLIKTKLAGRGTHYCDYCQK